MAVYAVTVYLWAGIGPPPTVLAFIIKGVTRSLKLLGEGGEIEIAVYGREEGGGGVCAYMYACKCSHYDSAK